MTESNLNSKTVDVNYTPPFNEKLSSKYSILQKAQKIHIGTIQGRYGKYATTPKKEFDREWYKPKESLPHHSVPVTQENLKFIAKITEDQLTSLWTVEEMALTEKDCELTLHNEQYRPFLLAFVIFFKTVDVLVSDNLNKITSKYHEITSCIDTINYVETVHNRTYQLFSDNSLLGDNTHTREENMNIIEELNNTLEEITTIKDNLLVNINFVESKIPIFEKLDQDELLLVYDCMTKASNQPLMTRTISFAIVEYTLLLLFNLIHKLSFIDSAGWKAMHEVNELVAIDETLHVKLGKYLYREFFLLTDFPMATKIQSMKNVVNFTRYLNFAIKKSFLKKLPPIAMGFPRETIIDYFKYMYNRFLDETFKDFEHYEPRAANEVDPIPELTLKEKVLDQNSFFERKGTYPDLPHNNLEKYVVENHFN